MNKRAITAEHLTDDRSITHIYISFGNMGNDKTEVWFYRGSCHVLSSRHTITSVKRATQLRRILDKLCVIASADIFPNGECHLRYTPKPAPTPAPKPTVTYNIMGTRYYPMSDNKSVLIVAVRGMGDYSWAAYMGLVDQDSDHTKSEQNRQLVAESGLKLYEWEARGIFQHQLFADIPYRR